MRISSFTDGGVDMGVVDPLQAKAAVDDGSHVLGPANIRRGLEMDGWPLDYVLLHDLLLARLNGSSSTVAASTLLPKPSNPVHEHRAERTNGGREYSREQRQRQSSCNS